MGGLYQPQPNYLNINQIAKKLCGQLYIWATENDKRVKAILKNPQIVEMQQSLFSSDLQSFSQRLKKEMDSWFEKINEIEFKIQSEGDLQARIKLQDDLIQQHKDFEDYLDNVNDMESKLDIGLQFLKDLKRNLLMIWFISSIKLRYLQNIIYFQVFQNSLFLTITQLKQKIDKLADTVNIIGDDVKKLRGKSFEELFNIRKRKVLDSMLLKSINQIYIPLKCQEWDPVSGKQKDEPSILLNDIYEQQDGEINKFLLKDSQEKEVLLLRGLAGSGKSRAAGKIEEFLWEQKDKKSEWLPIYVSLPTLKEPKFNLVDQALESEFYQFDKIQIREFKEAIQQKGLKIILILDSYDEMKQDCIQTNLIHTNRFAQDLFGHIADTKMVKNYLKVIITTRTEILSSSNYQTWFYGENLKSLKEVELLGFNQEQKLNYLEQYAFLCMKREFFELHNYNQINSLNDQISFQLKIQEFQNRNPSTRVDYLVSEKQANQICIMVKQEKLYHKLSKDQLVCLEKKLIDLWSVKKFEKLIISAQIQHLLTTPFMMEIVVQVLPSMTLKYSEKSQFKEKFIANFIEIKRQEHEERILIAKFKEKKNQNFAYKEILSEFNEKQGNLEANKIWDQLQNEKNFLKLSLVDKIYESDFATIDEVNIVIRALIIKKLTVFDFYLTFVDFYHIQQIKKQLDLGRNCNQNSLLIDLFNFSQSLAIDTMDYFQLIIFPRLYDVKVINLNSIQFQGLAKSKICEKLA